MKKIKEKKEWKALPLINFSTQVNEDDPVPKYLGNRPNSNGKNHPVANYNLKDYNYNEKINIFICCNFYINKLYIY